VTTATSYTIDELISVCICRQIVDGEVVGQGIATPLVMAGVLLAKLTHAQNVWFASAVGGTLCRDWAPLSLTGIEKPWLDHGLLLMSFPRISCEFLPRFNVKEFFRPAQVDACGNFNNIFIGGDYQHPQMRLPGSGGIPDVTIYDNHAMLYVPRHSRAVFVEQVDFVSGLGHTPNRSAGRGPQYCITDLGQFDFANGVMRLTSYHPGQAIEKIQAKTGFALEIAPAVHETEPPTIEEVRLLREEIDPLGVRKLETLSRAQRKGLIREILKREA
jgi:acyl CoA:acetate/3-ketoacid CoA transferase beta subunit